MFESVERSLSKLINSNYASLLVGGKIGLEKESLRVSPDGSIAQTPHPDSLGSALMHPYITTDYSEALLEFITPPMRNMADALEYLQDVQKFSCDRLGSELLWATSMPCVVAGESSIPIAQYGSSNQGQMKTVYRRGLGYRYGRAMQVIAGVHFNYSIPDNFWPAYRELIGSEAPLQDFISEQYFGLIRNLLRFGWLIPYLFGASPAVCKSFLNGKPTELNEFDASTFYEPFATSLRMGDIGYQNNRENEIGIKASYDNVERYAASLECAVTTPYAGYEDIGVLVDGEYRQLNANILQIENEYYSTVRPKQLLQGMEKPTSALRRRGVQYVELRSLDVNAFHPLGVDEVEMRFIEALFVFCLLLDSPLIEGQERIEIDANELASAHRGRDPQIELSRSGSPILLTDWANEICNSMRGVCDVLDAGCDGTPYSDSLATQREAIRDSERTPSARMLAEMRKSGEGFYHFARRMSHVHQEYFDKVSVSAAREQELVEMARRSRQQQAELEASNQESFAEYLKQYFEQS